MISIENSVRLYLKNSISKSITNYFSFQFQSLGAQLLRGGGHKAILKKIADCFVGEKIGDIPIEGNPWRWEADDWVEYEDYDISTDFPPIREWEKKMSGVENR